PALGLTDEIEGASGEVGTVRYVYWSAGETALVPPGVVTVTSTVDEPGGTMAATAKGEIGATPVADALPKWTADASASPAPTSSTRFPPLPGPRVAESPVTVGVGGVLPGHSSERSKPTAGGGIANGDVVTFGWDTSAGAWQFAAFARTS